MSYSVEWHPKVGKFLRKLPKDISERIVLDVDFKNKVLLVQVIGHRSNIYERNK